MQQNAELNAAKHKTECHKTHRPKEETRKKLHEKQHSKDN